MNSSPEETRGKPLDIQRFRRLFFGPFVSVLLVLKVLVALIWLGMTLPIQWDLSFPEGAVVARALDVARGEIPYHDWVEWPHAFAPYGPLTYYTAGWVGRLVGGDNLMETVRTVGRLQSQLSLVGLLVLAVLLLRRMKVRWTWTLFGVAAALAWESLFAYAVSFRPDGPQVFFALLGLYIAAGGSGEKRGRAALALGALFVSFWFKATSWGILAALAFWLWRGCGPARTAIRLALFGAAGMIPALILNELWDGRLFQNLVGSLDNGADFQNFATIFLKIPLAGWFILLFGGANAFLHWLKSPMDSPIFLLALGTLCSIAATLLATMKVGADVNYYLEPFILCAVWAVFAVWELWELPADEVGQQERPRIELQREIPLTILLLPFLLFMCSYSLTGALDDIRDQRALWQEPPIIQRVKRLEGPILTTFPCLVLESGGPPSILDHYQYRVLADRGLLKRSDLLNRLRSKKFDAVVIEGSPAGLSEDFFLPEFEATLFESYFVSESYGGTSVFVPRPPIEPPSSTGSPG